MRAVVVLLVALCACGGEVRGVPDAVPGRDERILVEVLNGTDSDGLARRLSGRLRRQGFDVVSFGSAAEPADTTRILARRGDTLAAARVRTALGTGRIEFAPDPRLLLDVSVILGPDAVTLGDDP